MKLKEFCDLLEFEQVFYTAYTIFFHINFDTEATLTCIGNYFKVEINDIVYKINRKNFYINLKEYIEIECININIFCHFGKNYNVYNTNFGYIIEFYSYGHSFKLNGNFKEILNQVKQLKELYLN